MNLSERRNPVRSFHFINHNVAFILKENAESIVKSLDNLNERTEILLKEGFALTKDMKQKKIRDMKMIDEVFEKITKKIMLKKA